MNLSFTRTEYENIKKSKELDEFSPTQFHAWINSNEDLFMKGESGEFENDLQKSEYNTLQNELAAFAKVEVWEEDKQSTIVKSEFYIREKQVDFTQDIQKSENGEDETITKGIYRDTALNRKLGRVGAEFGSEIQKGVYVNDKENQKLGRVGQKYGSEGKEESKKEEVKRPMYNGDIFDFFNKTKSYLHNKFNEDSGIAVTKSGISLSASGEGSVKSYKNYLDMKQELLDMNFEQSSRTPYAGDHTLDSRSIFTFN